MVELKIVYMFRKRDFCTPSDLNTVSYDAAYDVFLMKKLKTGKNMMTKLKCPEITMRKNRCLFNIIISIIIIITCMPLYLFVSSII